MFVFKTRSTDWVYSGTEFLKSRIYWIQISFSQKSLSSDTICVFMQQFQSVQIWSIQTTAKYLSVKETEYTFVFCIGKSSKKDHGLHRNAREKVQGYCSVSDIICHNHWTIYSSSASLMITVTQGLPISYLLSIQCNKEEGVIITFLIKLVPDTSPGIITPCSYLAQELHLSKCCRWVQRKEHPKWKHKLPIYVF